MKYRNINLRYDARAAKSTLFLPLNPIYIYLYYQLWEFGSISWRTNSKGTFSQKDQVNRIIFGFLDAQNLLLSHYHFMTFSWNNASIDLQFSDQVAGVHACKCTKGGQNTSKGCVTKLSNVFTSKVFCFGFGLNVKNLIAFSSWATK